MSVFRKLFGLSENNTPDGDWRVAIGKSNTISKNITLTNFYALLMGKLGFLKVTNNLSDLANPATARTNLGVYSKTEVDNKVGTGAVLLETGTGAVLGINNLIDPAIPSNLKNAPATQGYAEKKGFVLAGVYNIGDAQGDDTEYTISLGATLPNNNYIVFVQAESTSSSYWDDKCVIVVTAKTTTSFKVSVGEFYSGKYGNKQLAWAVHTL